jgi:hypothetical protein
MYGNEGTWYTVSDPLGYCELDCHVKDDVMFILCDTDGNEYYRYSNADKNPLPKFETVIRMEWDKVKDKIPHNTENHSVDFWAEAIYGETTLGINQWLLTFKNPDLYKKEIDDMYGYDENWLYCRTEEVKYEPIDGKEFSYLGNKYQFTKVTNRHTVCGVEWIEYQCTDVPYVIDDWTKRVNSYMTLGNWYDKTNIGAMMDKRSANLLTINMLKEIYPCEEKTPSLLWIRTDTFYGTDKECHILYRISYKEAAEKILGKELHRGKVFSLLADEKENHSFCLYTKENKKEILAQYPEIMDRTYDYYKGLF